MADIKISALPLATVLLDTDEFVIASGGTNKKINGATLRLPPPDGIGGGGDTDTFGVDWDDTGTAAGMFNMHLDDLLDVFVPAPNDEEVLSWDAGASGGTWVAKKAILFNFIDAKGDLIVGFDHYSPARLPVGANKEILIADSSQPYGVKWGPADETVIAPLPQTLQFKVVTDATTLTTGDGKFVFCIPTSLDGFHLTAAHAFCSDPPVGGPPIPLIQIRNVSNGFDMLSTRITIDLNEVSSYTAATGPAIDVTHATVVKGDLISVDVDAAGNGTKGLGVHLTFSP